MKGSEVHGAASATLRIRAGPHNRCDSPTVVMLGAFGRGIRPRLRLRRYKKISAVTSSNATAPPIAPPITAVFDDLEEAEGIDEPVLVVPESVGECAVEGSREDVVGAVEEGVGDELGLSTSVVKSR